MIRKILAVVIGIVAGSAFNMAIVMASHIVYPLPEGIDPNDFEAFKAHVEAHGLPIGALIMVLAAHSGGSLVSGFVCGLIAKTILVCRRHWTGDSVDLRRHIDADDASLPNLVCSGGRCSVHTGCFVRSPIRWRVDGQ